MRQGVAALHGCENPLTSELNGPKQAHVRERADKRAAFVF